jgi:cellulose synthase operon protein C
VDREAEILKHLTVVDDRTVKPAYLSQYAQVLLHQGKTEKARLDEALLVVGRLEQMETTRQLERGAFGTVELRARVLEAQDKGKEALEMLQTFAHRRGAKPEDLLLPVASLGRQKQIPAAFDLCDKEDLWKLCPPQVIGGVSVALLRAMPTADEHRDRIQHWLEETIKANPKVTVLKMHLADLYDLRGDYEKAKEVHRDILKDEPSNVVALNNLASLMSLNAEQGKKLNADQGKEALKYVETAISGMGRRADLLDTRGQVQLALGNTTAALTDFKEASEDMPSASRLFHLARAQYEARDREAAQRTLQKARADFGLQPSAVHPTEQQVCQTLLSELKVR